jgi:hypothetical protein
MTVHNRFHPTINLRTPVIAAGFATVALASFAAGAITFDGPGRSSGAGDPVAAVSAALPASPGVGTLTRDQVLAADRVAHDAFADAYAASSGAGDPVAAVSAALPASPGVGTLTRDQVLAADRAANDAFADAHAASPGAGDPVAAVSAALPASPGVGTLTRDQVLAADRAAHDAFADAHAALSGTVAGTRSSGTLEPSAGVPVTGIEFTAAMVAEEHEAYISRIIP